MLAWKQMDERHYEAALEGEMAVGHVQCYLTQMGNHCGSTWSTFGGVENPERTVCAGFQGWFSETRAEAEARCERLAPRLRKWVNGAGPTEIPPLAWEPDGHGGEVARHGCITANLFSSGDLWIQTELGEEEDRLFAAYTPTPEEWSSGYYESPAAPKEFAQKAVGELVRWLGGDPLSEVEVGQ